MFNRKSLVLILLIFFPIVGLFSFDAEYLNRISIINKTGADIWYVFLSPGDSDEWGFDILGSERTLVDNSLLSFFISYPEYENYFDIMAIDEEGNTFVLFDELFSDDGEINIIITEGDLEDDNPEIEFIKVDFENQTDYELLYLFVSPHDSKMWGVDMMDDEQTLEPMNTLSLLAPSDKEEVSYDVMAVDTDGDEYKFSLNVHFDYVDSDNRIWIPIEYSDLVE